MEHTKQPPKLIFHHDAHEWANIIQVKGGLFKKEKQKGKKRSLFENGSYANLVTHLARLMLSGRQPSASACPICQTA